MTTVFDRLSDLLRQNNVCFDVTHHEPVYMTGLKPGSIPPFGSLFGLKTYCDARLRDETVINFNAGDHSISISLPFADYERIEQPLISVLAE